MTDFKEYFLLNDNDSPSQFSRKVSVIVTAVFWFVFFVSSIFVKPVINKPKYKEVKIVLSSTPEVKKAKESPAPAAAAPAAAPAPAPAPKKAAETPKPKAEPKKAQPKNAASKAPEKKAPAPAKTKPVEEVTYALDPMEAFNQQTSSKKKQDFDWSQFDDEPSAETVSTSTSAVAPKIAENSFSGSAGTTASTKTNTKQSSQSTADSKSNNTTNATKNALGRITNSTFQGYASNGVESEVAVKASKSGTGEVMMQMSDGQTRALIEPKEPTINLSEAAAKTIDGSRTVTIEFAVNEQGHVPYSDIDITPESLLSEIVRKEIKDQISKWRFEATSYSSVATFEYKIIKQ